MVEEAYPSHKAISFRKAGMAHTVTQWQNTATRFMMKKGAQQITKVENTIPSTRLAFSSETVDVCSWEGLGRKGRAESIVFLPSLVVS